MCSGIIYSCSSYAQMATVFFQQNFSNNRMFVGWYLSITTASSFCPRKLFCFGNKKLEFSIICVHFCCCLVKTFSSHWVSENSISLPKLGIHCSSDLWSKEATRNWDNKDFLALGCRVVGNRECYATPLQLRRYSTKRHMYLESPLLSTCKLDKEHCGETSTSTSEPTTCRLQDKHCVFLNPKP